jgi:inorganic pyrophosphatase/exopolyphosphatase
MAACISSIKVTELKNKEGNVYGELKEVKFWDKVKALDLAMKHLGLNAPKKVELSTTKDEDTQVKFYMPENGRN